MRVTVRLSRLSRTFSTAPQSKKNSLSFVPHLKARFAETDSGREGLLIVSAIEPVGSEYFAFAPGGIELNFVWKDEFEEQKSPKSFATGSVIGNDLGSFLVPTPKKVSLSENKASSAPVNIGGIQIVDFEESRVRVRLSAQECKLVADIPKNSWNALKNLVAESIIHAFGFAAEFRSALEQAPLRDAYAAYEQNKKEAQYDYDDYEKKFNKKYGIDLDEPVVDYDNFDHFKERTSKRKVGGLGGGASKNGKGGKQKSKKSKKSKKK